MRRASTNRNDKKPKRDQALEQNLEAEVTPTFNFYSTRLSWEEAFDACKVAKGTLARIHNAERQRFLEEFFRNNKNIDGQFWIDASYRVKHKKIDNWVYSNGKRLDYNNGLPEEMNQKRKQCAHFGTETEPKFQWTSGGCHQKKGFICEIFPDKGTPRSGQPVRDASSYQVTLDIRKTSKTWMKAKRSCERWGGHLLRIPDAEFQGLVVGTLDSMKTDPVEDTFWIDAHFDKKKMQYINSNGQKVDHSNFAEGFPKGGCAYLRKSGGEWKWEDGDCDADRPFICARATQNGKPTKPAKPSRDKIQTQLPTTYLQYFTGYMYTWQEAAEYCAQEGDGTGHLLRIVDQNMFNEVAKAVKGSAANFWLDANDLMLEGKFVYSDDSPLGYTNWFEIEGVEKQPDGGKAENCVYMSYSDDYMWHDGNCNDRMSFICAFSKKPVKKAPPRIPEGAVIDDIKPVIIAEPSTTPEPDISAILTYEGSSAEPNHGPDSKMGWIAALSDRNQYVIFDFHQFVRVDVLVLCGVNVPGYMAWITQFRLLYKRSADAEWRPYIQFDGTSEFDNVITNADECATFLFDPPILGSLVKFQPIRWKNAIAGRFTFNGRPSAAPRDISDKVDYKMSSAVRNFRPGSKYGWIARKSNNRQYLIADFRQTVELYGMDVEKVIVGNREGWIQALKVEYSDDGDSWLPYELDPANKNGVIEVPYDDSNAARIRHIVPIVARYIKIIPVKWHKAIAGKIRFIGYRYKDLKFRKVGAKSKGQIASDQGAQPTVPSKVEEEETGLAYDLDKFIDSYYASASAKGFEPGSARGWLSPLASAGQFLMVAFQDMVRIRRLKVGGIQLENYSAWIKKFRILYKTKEDEDWTVYMYDDNKDEFEAPKDASPDQTMTFDLPSPIRAKYVKFQPTEWEKAIGAKLSFFGSRLLGRRGNPRERRTMRLYYSFHKDKVSWSGAQAACQTNGGSLARVFAPKVQEALEDLIEDIKIEGDWWIDASDANTEDQWATSVGPLPYADWLSGKQPASVDGKDCGFLMYAENYKWDHANCEEIKHYICQYENEPKKKPAQAQLRRVRLFSYRFFSRRLAWVEAQAACRERGASLVQIPDLVVQNFLGKSMKTRGRTWLDLTYNVAFPDTDAWLCSSGLPMTYNNGLPLEIEGQSCAITRKQDLAWIPEECEAKHPYICQQQPTSLEETLGIQRDDTQQAPEEVTGIKKQSFQIVRMVGGYTWRDAKKYCNDLGAHLLRIQSQEEQNLVVNFLETNKLQDEFWLDAQVPSTGGKCMKSNGQEVTFNKFQVQVGRSRRRRGCVYFSNEDGWSWKFSSCSDKKNFICQAESDQRLTEPQKPQRDVIQTPQLKPVSVYYQFYRGGPYASKWMEAQQFCRKAARGGGSGHLARIKDQETMDYLIKMLSRGKRARSLVGNFWFDASDVQTEGKYVDSSGEALDYTNWFSVGNQQEPNGGTAENCAFISTEHAFKWHDEACDHTLDGFICQFSTRPKVKPSPPQRDFERMTAIRADLSFPRGKFTWQSGTRYCKRKYPANGGGHLLRFRNKEEEAQIVSSLFDQNRLGDFYLDARLQSDGTWADSNGVVLPFTNWVDGEPPQDDDNTCAILKLKEDGSYSWGANDCKKPLPLICVKYVAGPKADLKGKRIRVKDKNRSSTSVSSKSKKAKSSN
ncbi:macrophage mannose receptor 1-like, partial [Acanthaster planci]|uniref:Macrophage mannose receptor 1-like n=1 Tax=Acanthaster planci TaxID=133434 RepID=A0A8B7ZB41_ACAPL